MYNNNNRKNEILYRYCKDEGLDYEYILNELLKEKRRARLSPRKLFRKLKTTMSCLFFKHSSSSKQSDIR